MLKNITLSAEQSLIESARDRARREKKTLNALFREWLSRYAGKETTTKEFTHLMDRLDYVRTSRKYSRVEMNER